MNATPELLTEIYAVIERYLAEQGDAPSNWVAQEVANKHRRIEGPDAEFCLKCTLDNIRDEVRAAIRRYDIAPEKDADTQLTLAGFKRLQRAYSVMRQGLPVAVLIENMSDVELAAKEDELRKFGIGNFEHADEMHRYRMDRRKAAQ